MVIDYDTKAILGAAKAPTTKEDLSVGILEALDALPPGFMQKAEIISLSTTLATNACVEGRGGSAALIFFGGDRRVIDKYGGEYGLPPSADMYIQESFSDFSGDFESEPDWGFFRESVRQGFRDLDGVGIIEIYAMKNSASVEKKARDIFREERDIPVVCGHELHNELNCLRRGASTLLNARLFPVIHSFLSSIKNAMSARGINAPVFIVRSDGSLMSDKFANIRPVETLLCGPAASVLGSAYLADQKNCVVVDMGGTTTDIALINNGVPVRAVGGVQVGKWKTFVSGLYIKTIGLGGDSAVHCYDGRLALEEYRVVPLCIAASAYPQITENLKRLLESEKKHIKHLHEHFMLIRDISGDRRYTDEERLFCSALKDGPLMLREAAESVPGWDLYKFNVSRLISGGVIQAIGLTPTDIMHINGDFDKYAAEASMLGARYVAYNMGVSVEELCERVYDEVKRKLYVNIVKVLLENYEDHYLRDGVGADVERLINDSYYMGESNLLSLKLATSHALTGIGAPIHIFLGDVAKKLGTAAVIPGYYDVANAIGAIAGSVHASYIIEIRPNYAAAGITGYTVSGVTETKVFDTLKEAEGFAYAEALEGARAEAVRRGARGEVNVTCALKTNEADTGDFRIYLGTRAVAQAVGAAGFL